jgi:ABC-type glycerol-3-phosphate transport system substrate-binding protein
VKILTVRRLVAVASAVAVAAGLAACGGRSAREEAAAVRVTLSQLQRATRTHDYATLCRRVLSRELVRKVAGAGLPCDVALRAGLQGVHRPRVKVEQVKVDGDRALAQIRSTAAGQKPSIDVIQLVREGGGWRVSSLAGPDPPAPAARDRG